MLNMYIIFFIYRYLMSKTSKKKNKVNINAINADEIDIEFDIDDKVNSDIVDNLEDIDNMLLKTQGLTAWKDSTPKKKTAKTETYIQDEPEEEPEEEPEDECSDLEEQEEPEDETEYVRAKQTKKPKQSKKKSIIKKGPGRPRKIPKKEPMPRKGISSISTDPDNYIEFLYDTPVYIRKLLGLFKSLAAAHIQIIFRQYDIILYAQDHYKKSRIRVRIDASKLNHYYCKNSLDIGISEKDLEVILNKVDGGYSSIILLSTTGNTQKNITLILDNDIQIDESHTIDLIGQYNHMDNEAEFIDENYMINFTLPGKYFRKTISDIKTMSQQLSITQQDNESSLVFEYFTLNKKIHSKHTVKNSSKIKLHSSLPDGDMFRVDIRIDHIKPISSAHIADEITILVDENKKFMTKAYIDNGTIEIKTLTEIIDDRPDDE